jgi:oligopeptide transport system ATP-binding protein
MSSALMAVEGLTQHFAGTRGGTVRAVEDVSFEMAPGEVLGLVGESGSGKTTIGQAMLRLAEPTAGRILFRDEDITALSGSALKPFRRQVQPVFQDPFGSLNPRLTVEAIIAEPLIVHGIARGREERRARILALLEQVGLPRDSLTRYPHQFSGGQRQRIAIARALAVEPALIIADEPVSALDVSIQAQIINLLRELQQRLKLAMLFIAHDLAVVEYISDRVIVLYLGRIMEVGPAKSLIGAPKHPYTEALISAVPEPDIDRTTKRIVLQGDLPSPIDPPSGCVFRTRCPYAISACAEKVPELREVSSGHAKACIRDDVL